MSERTEKIINGVCIALIILILMSMLMPAESAPSKKPQPKTQHKAN